jgi:hypothetical protein
MPYILVDLITRCNKINRLDISNVGKKHHYEYHRIKHHQYLSSHHHNHHHHHYNYYCIGVDHLTKINNRVIHTIAYKCTDLLTLDISGYDNNVEDDSDDDDDVDDDDDSDG